MADIIHLLPDSVANQIAAGEVVQRPASVVKELIENSVDSASSVIYVIIKEGGKTLVQISDNGCGMSDTDARMAFERHATSKIVDASDLFEIRTLGFRGEALASIAAVAHVTLKTRQHSEELGTEIIISGSKVESQNPVSCQAGCNILVKNLFYNIPARRKFLKSTQTEFRHIIDEFQHIALSHPDIEFKLYHNEEEIYNLPSTNLKQRILHLFGKSINSNLTPIEVSTSIIQLKGFIGKPEFAKKKFGEQFFFINNRYMRHSYFHRAIMNAYEKILPPETVPSYFIYFETDPKTIDVNIHPTKTEIKFEDEQSIFQIIKASTREALGKSNIMPSIDFNTEESIEIPVFNRDKEIYMPEIETDPGFDPFKEKINAGEKLNSSFIKSNKNLDWEKFYEGFKNDEDHPESFDINDKYDQKEIEIAENVAINSFMQIKNKYILTPVKSGLMIIDQKRAYERIIYEKIIHSLAAQGGVAQKSLFPEAIELTPKEYSLLKEIFDNLHEIGFNISDLGTNTISVNGCPAELKNPNPKELIESILEDYSNDKSDYKTGAKKKLAQALAKAAAVDYAIKLNYTEMQEIIDSLFACEDHNFSPSGKKILNILSLDKLDKELK